MYINKNNILNLINMKKLHKIHFLKIITIFFIIFILIACKKRHPDEFREPFTEEQMGWISNLENPKYKCITKSTNSQGDTIITIDTVLSKAGFNYEKTSVIQNDEYLITYYEGHYVFYLSYNTLINDFVFYNLEIEINNLNDFQAILNYNVFHNNITFSKVDTAFINGICYNEVYKIENFDPNCPEKLKKAYFKRGIGFLYLEKYNGSNATLIENTAKPNRFLKPVRFK